jgi:hypothetical protein
LGLKVLRVRHFPPPPPPFQERSVREVFVTNAEKAEREEEVPH